MSDRDKFFTKPLKLVDRDHSSDTFSISLRNRDTLNKARSIDIAKYGVRHAIGYFSDRNRLVHRNKALIAHHKWDQFIAIKVQATKAELACRTLDPRQPTGHN
jgi:hypothetical protein